MQYTSIPINPEDEPKCYYCGADACIMLEADQHESDNGYKDSIELCPECFEKEIADKLGS